MEFVVCPVVFVKKMLAGRSAAVSALNVGRVAVPVTGPANIMFADWLPRVATTAPVDPEFVKRLPSPVKELAPLHVPQTGSAPFEIKHWPLLPTGKRVLEREW